MSDSAPLTARSDAAQSFLFPSRWERWGRSRWYPLALAGLAMLLASPSLRVGWIADDYIHRAKLLGSPRFDGLLGSPTDLFAFFDGNPQHTWRLMDIGLLPWWTDPHIRGAFWRPVTVATHWLDYALWPHSSLLMHAQSLLWLGVLVFAVSCVYRRFLDPRLAALAALLYAVDDARGTPTAFLANRNALIASCFGVLTVLAHHRWRRRGGFHNAAAASLLLSLSLLSGEIGIATVAYLVGYAAFIDRSPPHRRWAALVPYAAVVVAWRAAWSALGYGILASDPYVDPLAEPLRFAGQVLLRAPALLLGQWFVPPSDVTVLLAGKQVWVYAAAAAALIFFIAVVVFRIVPRERRLGFWLTGMLLSVPPVCAVFSSDRLLPLVGVGAMGLLAQFLMAARARREWSFARTLATTMIVVHGVIAPLGLVFRAAYPAGPPALYDELLVRTPFDGTIEDQDLIVVNAPSAFHAGFLPLMRDLDGLPVPRHMRVLAPGLPAVTIHRADLRTLEIRPTDGYVNSVFDRLFRGRREALRAGDQVRLTGVRIEVLKLTEDSRPAAVRFEFDVALEDPSLRWLQWIDGEFVAFAPPAVGTTIELRPTRPWLVAVAQP